MVYNYGMDLGINNLFKKYSDIELKIDGTLFGIDPMIAIKQKRCPYCGNKLYEMRGKPFWYCKSKKHKRRFIISKEKMAN